jgi:hypothetical protein
MPDYTLKQSGKKETFPGGAQRDTQKGKPRYDLIPPLALRRVADLYTKGAEHYGDRNWEKGMKFSRFFGSLLRHAYQFAMGHKEEDHLAAVVFNALAIMHFQETQRVDLNDMSAFKSLPRRRRSYIEWDEENLEKPLTSKPPPAKVKTTEPVFGPMGDRRRDESHPQGKVGGSVQWACSHCGTEWIYSIPGSVCVAYGPKCPKCLDHLTTIGGSFRGGTSQLHPTH